MRFFSLLLSCKSCKRFQRTDAREMEIVIAPDKFKDTLTAAEAAGAIADGIDRAARRAGRTDVRLILKPMADGGEGSLGILAGDEGEYHPVETFDALMRPVQSAYAVLPGNSGKYAAVEAASAVGLYRLDREERNPLRTTSYGVGKVMREAIEAGCTELIAAVGGTATSDCGAGMLAALGCRFLDGQNRLIDYPAGGDLIRFDAIDTAPLYHLTQGCRFKVLCDVDNPLTGPKGAAAVFAPQKGADAAAVALLEAGAEHFAAKAAAATGHDCRAVAGSGAAGGIAWALKTFCGADRYRRGHTQGCARSHRRGAVRQPESPRQGSRPYSLVRTCPRHTDHRPVRFARRGYDRRHPRSGRHIGSLRPDRPHSAARSLHPPRRKPRAPHRGSLRLPVGRITSQPPARFQSEASLSIDDFRPCKIIAHKTILVHAGKAVSFKPFICGRIEQKSRFIPCPLHELPLPLRHLHPRIVTEAEGPGKEAESGKTNFMTSANGDRKGLLYRRGRQVVLRGMKFHGYRLGCPVHITITGCANIIDMFSLSALFLLRCRPLVATRNERRRTQHRPQQTPISSRFHNALFLIHCFSII